MGSGVTSICSSYRLVNATPLFLPFSKQRGPEGLAARVASLSGPLAYDRSRTKWRAGAGENPVTAQAPGKGLRRLPNVCSIVEDMGRVVNPDLRPRATADPYRCLGASASANGLEQTGQAGASSFIR
jgi:hypothetical protein